MSYLYAFLGFALLIVLHEAGHFVAAKAVGMRVERFSLFFGPMWLKRRFGETEYGVGVIPLGGYVRITGMTSSEDYETPEIEARAYYNQAVWKRIVVISAGPAVNLVLAFILAWVYFFSSQVHPQMTANGQPVAIAKIGAIERHSPAAAVLKLNDVLVSVDGVSGSVVGMRRQIQSHGCAGGAKVNGCEAVTPVTLVVRRHGALRTFKLRPRYSTADHESLIGVKFYDKTVRDGAVYSAGQSVAGLGRVTARTVSDIAQIFRAKDRKQLNGVVGAYVATQQYFQSGLATGLEVLAVISLSLGVINLFPFLPLDGGHIFWALAEKLRGRAIPFATMERAGLVGVAVILILFAIGISNDISSLASGNGFGVH